MSPELLLSQPTSVTGAVAVTPPPVEDDDAAAESASVIELDRDVELPVEPVVDGVPVDPGVPELNVNAGVGAP